MEFLTIPTSTVSAYPPPQAAVTTIFTPPDFCVPYVDASNWISSLSESHLSSCFPGSPSLAGRINSVYYSPGICPSGYTVDCLRFDDDQGPSNLSGETAAICCPSSFTCVAYDPLHCVSTAKFPKSTRKNAVPVQIRWRESDLPLFETPPVPGRGIPSHRHSGWGPDSSLLSVYTFPPECSSLTAVWLEGDAKTYQPLTGDYYSPAICPDGWTAAYARPVVSGRGPPEEPNETAMYCCPSGLTSGVGFGCGQGACVSTTIISASTGFDIELVMSRPAIQIRWESSDLSNLQTHPLTPGLTLATHFPSSNHTVLLALQRQDQLGLALAFIPVALALVGVLVASILLESRRQTSASTLQTHFFRPAILRRRVIVILISFMISAIVLIEISCHVLPSNSDVTASANLSRRSLTKVYVSELTMRPGQPRSESQYKLTCDVEGDYSLSYITTINHGTTATESVTVAANSLESGVSTVCRIQDEVVSIRSCMKPLKTETPHKDMFLSATESTVEGGYVVGTIIPSLAAVAFGIPWKILAAHATSLEPFHQLSRSTGAQMSAFLYQYQGIGALLAPLTAICWIMTYTTAALAPLAAEGWKIKLEGFCSESSSNGCIPVVIVSNPVARTLEALLALNIILALAMTVVLSRWSTGLHADPRSIIGVASLSHSKDFLTLFTSYPKPARWWQWWKVQERHFAHLPLRYGYDRDDATGHQEFGILYPGSSDTTEADTPTQQITQEQSIRKYQSSRGFPVKITLEFGCFALCLAALDAIIIYYRLTPDNQALGRFLSGRSFGPRFLFSLVGVTINFLWAAIFSGYLAFAPFLELSSGPRTSSKSIALPFASDSYTYFVDSLASGRFQAVSISLSTVLSDFLPLTLANIPFDRTTTWKAYEISTWTSVGIIGFMLTTLLIMILSLISKRQKWLVSTKKIRENPIAYSLYTLERSTSLMKHLVSLSELTTRERNLRVCELKLRYDLAEVNDRGSGRYRAFIHVSPSVL